MIQTLKIALGRVENIVGKRKNACNQIHNRNVVQSLKIALGWVENIAGKGENAGFQHFLLFPQCYQKASCLGSLKVGIVWQRDKPQIN